MTLRKPDLVARFRRAIDQDGSFRRAQKMPAHDRQSYLRGLWQVWYAVNGRKAVKS